MCECDKTFFEKKAEFIENFKKANVFCRLPNINFFHARKMSNYRVNSVLHLDRLEFAASFDSSQSEKNNKKTQKRLKMNSAKIIVVYALKS